MDFDTVLGPPRSSVSLQLCSGVMVGVCQVLPGASEVENPMLDTIVSVLNLLSSVCPVSARLTSIRGMGSLALVRVRSKDEQFEARRGYQVQTRLHWTTRCLHGFLSEDFKVINWC